MLEKDLNINILEPGDKETRRLITPEKIIGEEGQKGFFSVEDYAIVKGGKADKFLKKIEKWWWTKS